MLAVGLQSLLLCQQEADAGRDVDTGGGAVVRQLGTLLEEAGAAGEGRHTSFRRQPSLKAAAAVEPVVEPAGWVSTSAGPPGNKKIVTIYIVNVDFVTFEYVLLRKYQSVSILEFNLPLKQHNLLAPQDWEFSPEVLPI